MIFGEKTKLKVYVNEHDFVSDIHIPSRSCLLLCFLYELLMILQSRKIRQLYIRPQSKLILC